MARWLVDGNNVMGSRPDGWWRDRPGAMGRLARELGAHAEACAEDVTVVFDGDDTGLRDPRVEVLFAPHADDAIAARAAAGTTVVTSDRELADRARRAGAEVVGARGFLKRLADEPD